MHPTWTEQWWPISYVQDLDPKQPSRFTLLDRDLVIWWDRAASSWRVFPDVCPVAVGRLAQRDRRLLGWVFSRACGTR